VFQGQGVAETAIARAAQRVQLGAQAPGAGRLAIHRFGDAVAMGRSDGQGEGLVADMHLVITQGNHTGQHRVAIEAQFQGFTVFQADPARRIGLEVARQVKAFAAVDGHQRRQVWVLLRELQLEQAGVDVGIGVGRVTQAFEDGAQGVGFDTLRASVGIDPVDGQTRSAGEEFQIRFAQGVLQQGIG
jgi:hypothetical protein